MKTKTLSLLLEILFSSILISSCSIKTKAQEDKTNNCNILKYSFKNNQLKYQRVKDAFKEKESIVKKQFKDKNIEFPPYQIFLRAFKKEKSLELWGRNKNNESFIFITSYKFSKLSGNLGPKRREGDLQVPEGVYYIDRFNPSSHFYLSLGINYPNESDNILGIRSKLGGDIFIHGGSTSIGCIPITDDKIKELYIIAVESKNNGQEKIPIHIYPQKLDDYNFSMLLNEYKENDSLINFWKNLKGIYDIFDRTKIIPNVKVDEKGRYVIY